MGALSSGARAYRPSLNRVERPPLWASRACEKGPPGQTAFMLLRSFQGSFPSGAARCISLECLNSTFTTLTKSFDPFLAWKNVLDGRRWGAGPPGHKALVLEEGTQGSFFPWGGVFCGEKGS